jgi:hypothetical protein
MKQAALEIMLLVGSLVLFAPDAHAAPIVLTDSSGHAIGIHDLVYAGSEYNVSLTGGTCADVFGSCEQSRFTFADQIGATGAEIAVNSVLYSAFSSQPDPDRNQFSLAVPTLLMVPFDMNTSTGFVTSAATVMSRIPDNEFPWFWSATQTSADYTSGSPTGAKGAWVVFTPVPEPATLSLLMVGFLALLLLRSKFHRERHDSV